jgi:uncharacterized protein YdhG (YjbR/CyaY superfamily)
LLLFAGKQGRKISDDAKPCQVINIRKGGLKRSDGMVDQRESNQVDDYIEQFTTDIQGRLSQVRQIIREAAPEAEETISYKMPTYVLNGNLVHFAAFENHLGLYPTPSGISAFGDDLANYKTAKGSVRFPHNEPLPLDLIRKIVEFRVTENRSVKAAKSRTPVKINVKKSTGKDWGEWFAVLKAEEAEKLLHSEIAELLTSTHSVPGWWAQTITVEFERLIGRRKVGQTGDGTFQTTTTKTMTGDLDQVFTLWLNQVLKTDHFNNQEFKEEPKISKSEKWRYWRVILKNGLKITASVGYKAADKSILSLTTEKLPDQNSIKEWKDYWTNYLKQLLSRGRGC